MNPDREGKTGEDGLQEVIHFQYQRMMRYRGQWHLEERPVLPGYIFLSGKEMAAWNQQMMRKDGTDGENGSIFLRPCETPFLKHLCPKGNLVGMSRGIMKQGILTVTSGPLQGKEHLVRRVDRHKRTAEIEIPLEGRRQRITVGLEIYEKEV